MRSWEKGGMGRGRWEGGGGSRAERKGEDQEICECREEE